MSAKLRHQDMSSTSESDSNGERTIPTKHRKKKMKKLLRPKLASSDDDSDVATAKSHKNEEKTTTQNVSFCHNYQNVTLYCFY